MKRFFFYLILTVVISALAGWGAAFYEHTQRGDVSKDSSTNVALGPKARADALLLASQKYAEAYAIRFNSEAGEILASGMIYLLTPLPSKGEVQGVYCLQMNQVRSKENDVMWFYRLFEAKDVGEVEWQVFPEQTDVSYILDFMPRLVDANIGARFKPLNNRGAEGKWSYAIFAGGYDAGTFEIEKK